MIFGTYFFLSEDVVHHYRFVYNIINLLAEFGGLNSVMLAVYKVLGSMLSINLINAKILKNLFFVPVVKDYENKSMKVNQVKLRFSDKYEKLYWLKSKLGLVNTDDKFNHQLYVEGLKQLEKSLSLVNLLQHINKFKAALSVLIG